MAPKKLRPKSVARLKKHVKPVKKIVTHTTAHRMPVAIPVADYYGTPRKR